VLRSILLILLLTSCSAEWHLNRALKKDPTIFNKEKIVVHDTTVITEEYSHIDSFYITDTMTYEDTVLKLKFIVKEKKIYFKATVKPDTIRVVTHDKVPYKVIEYQDSKYLYKSLPFILLVILAIILYKLLK
jgi:hypothetical protein